MSKVIYVIMLREAIVMKCKIGDIIKGEVTGIEDYGVFVRLEDGYNGLIHISEITGGFVSDINDYVKIGEHIFVHILDLNEKCKQMKLSIKNINYKEDGKTQNIPESIRGFLPLQENLPIWTEEKLKEIDE